MWTDDTGLGQTSSGPNVSSASQISDSNRSKTAKLKKIPAGGLHCKVDTRPISPKCHTPQKGSLGTNGYDTNVRVDLIVQGLDYSLIFH